jgi:hypothetical protein
VSLSLSDVRRIAHDVARQNHPTINVVGATATGGSDYTEVIVTLERCAEEPRLLSIGITRDMSESSLRRSMDERLRQHLAEHRSRVNADRPVAGTADTPRS